MWAAWGGTGSLDVIKLLVSRGADPYKRNRQDAGLAHWAAEGGANLQMCRYLHDELHIRFDEEDKEGNTPFHLAESNGHQDIAEWIASLSDEEECKEDVEVSPDLSANRTLSNV
jgi:ankyrin repeat protein